MQPSVSHGPSAWGVPNLRCPRDARPAPHHQPGPSSQAEPTRPHHQSRKRGSHLPRLSQTHDIISGPQAARGEGGRVEGERVEEGDAGGEADQVHRGNRKRTDARWEMQAARGVWFGVLSRSQPRPERMKGSTDSP